MSPPLTNLPVYVPTTLDATEPPPPPAAAADRQEALQLAKQVLRSLRQRHETRA